jgi:hypothetical protein
MESMGVWSSYNLEIELRPASLPWVVVHGHRCLPDRSTLRYAEQSRPGIIWAIPWGIVTVRHTFGSETWRCNIEIHLYPGIPLAPQHPHAFLPTVAHYEHYTSFSHPVRSSFYSHEYKNGHEFRTQVSPQQAMQGPPVLFTCLSCHASPPGAQGEESPWSCRKENCLAEDMCFKSML